MGDASYPFFSTNQTQVSARLKDLIVILLTICYPKALSNYINNKRIRGKVVFRHLKIWNINKDIIKDIKRYIY